MKARLKLGDGTVVRHGEHHDFGGYEPLQRALYPVVSTVDPEDGEPERTFRVGPRTLYGVGTAVCIGAGWFVTAKHVVEPFDRQHQRTGEELLFVVLETDTLLPSGDGSVYGGMLPVRGYSMHSSCDLATLTAELPSAGVPEIRKLDLSLRMPDVGEPVVVVGYSVMKAVGDLPSSGPAAIEWERTLRASVGVVTEQKDERTVGWYRPGPGFVTDAPAFSGMSGGPILDGTLAVLGFVSSSIGPSEGAGWTSFGALMGPVLELSVLDLVTGATVDPESAPEVRVSTLVQQGAIELDMYESCDVDPATGLVKYTAT